MGSVQQSGETPLLSAEWTPLGLHRWRFTSPILWIELHGDFLDSDFDEYVVMYRQLFAANPNLGLIANTAQMKGTSPTVRKRIPVEIPSNGPSIPIALLGASLAVRTLVTLVANGQRLLFRRELPIAFFSDEKAAQAWVLQRIAEQARHQASQAVSR